MNALQYVAFLDEVRLNPQPCCHGHSMCSSTEGGPCADEQYALLTQAERDEVDGRDPHEDDYDGSSAEREGGAS